MNEIWNQLEKLPPPPFITIKVPRGFKPRCTVSNWSQMMTSVTNSNLHCSLLKTESVLLAKFIERKGTQLRLEKALLLTQPICKVIQRWRSNGFQRNLNEFDLGMRSESERVPSQQWAVWIVYLGMRESALLVKIKLECENATKFWLGLISASHHWGDSLVVTAILSRIWHLTSVLAQGLIESIYPRLLQISKVLPPNKSPPWPYPEWKSPEDLKGWLMEVMGLNFGFLNVSREPSKSSEEKKSLKISSLLTKVYKADDDSFPAKVMSPQIQYSKNEVEDLGVPVQIEATRKRKGRSKIDIKETIHTDPKNWLIFKKYWKKLLINYETKLSTKLGRKKLIARVKKFRKVETDPKIRKKLNLLIKASEDEDALRLFRDFEGFINKKVKRLKKK